MKPILPLLVSLVFTLFAQAQECYEILPSKSGITKFYHANLDKKACDLKEFMEQLSDTDFHVFGSDYFPASGQITPPQQADRLFQEEIDKLEPQFESFVLLGKIMGQGEKVAYKTFIQLPQTAPFDKLRKEELIMINQRFLKAINNRAKRYQHSINFSSAAEFAGLRQLQLLLIEIVENELVVANNRLDKKK